MARQFSRETGEMIKQAALIELVIGIICALCSVYLLTLAESVIGTDDSPIYAGGFTVLFMIAVMCILDFVSYLKHNKVE